MGWLTGKPKTANRWSGPHDIAVSSIRASHSVERGRRTPARYMRQPIYVTRSGFGYRIHDGNHRLQVARANGQRTIRAYVREA